MFLFLIMLTKLNKFSDGKKDKRDWFVNILQVMHSYLLYIQHELLQGSPNDKILCPPSFLIKIRKVR